MDEQELNTAEAEVKEPGETAPVEQEAPEGVTAPAEETPAESDQ